MPLVRASATALALAHSAGSPSNSQFIGFNGSGLKSFTGGGPNKVGSPAITLSDLPVGPKSVIFKLTETSANSAIAVKTNPWAKPQPNAIILNDH